MLDRSHTASSPTVTLVRNGPVNTACRTLIEESSGCEDDQAALQGAENRSCLAQVMRSVTVGLDSTLSANLKRATGKVACRRTNDPTFSDLLSGLYRHTYDTVWPQRPPHGRDLWSP